MKFFKKIKIQNNVVQLFLDAYKSEMKLAVPMLLVVFSCTVYISVLLNNLWTWWNITVLSLMILIGIKYLIDRRWKLLKDLKEFEIID